MKLSSEFLKHAKMLVRVDGNRPSQINLRRAESAAYYAVFHAICAMFAEAIVGDGKELRRAWGQAYRSLNHKTVCNRLMNIHDFLESNKKENHTKQLDFPISLVTIASTFSSLKDKREEADYNPLSKTMDASNVVSQIALAERAIKDLRQLDDKHRTALAIFIGISNNR